MLDDGSSGGPVLVIGLGNLLLGDEGLGVHALGLLQERFSDPRVRFVDGGTRGLSLLPLMEDASRILLLDAVRAPARPGTVVELSGEELVASPPLKFSAHDIALTDLLALLVLRSRISERQLHLAGAVPGAFDSGTELSADVRRALAELVDRAAEKLRAWLESGTTPSRIRCAPPGTDRVQCIGEEHVPRSTGRSSVRPER